LRVLCRRGRKRLTIEDRRSVLGRPSLNPEDQALLDWLALQMHSIEQRVSLLETTQEHVTALLRSIGFPDQVRQLADAIGFSPPVIMPPTPLPLDVPPLPVR